MYENVQEFLKSRHLHEDHINGNKEIYNKLLLNDSKLVVLFESKMVEDNEFKNDVMSHAKISNDIYFIEVTSWIEPELLYDKVVNIMNVYLQK